MERTFGTAAFDGGKWRIDCEPQVALRLKRVFAKLTRTTKGTLTIADSIETCRELAWFMQRYPLVMSGADRERLERGETQHKILASDVARILSGEYQPREYNLALPLRQYQKLAADLALRTRGLLVGDDVGLGKTAVGIGVLSDPECRPALVVSLTHLPRQWKAEIERFLPGIRVHILKKAQPYPLEGKTLLDRGLPDVIVTSYSKLDGWCDELAGKMRAVIFDEVQELRHAKNNTGTTLKYGAAKRIAHGANVRCGLSATPIHNYAGELHNIMEVLNPGALGTKEEFRTEWCKEHESKDIVEDPKALGSFMREAGLMIRRTRIEVGRELPALTIVPHVLEVDFEDVNRMVGSAAELARTILAQGGAPLEKMKAAGELDWRLRQATGIAKAPFVADLVRLLTENGEKVLVGGWHHEVYAVLREKLADLAPVFFTGEESITQKEEAKRRFVEGDSKVLVMSVRAGAGIDGLQKVCSTAVIAEPDWSPAVQEQFIGRIHRDGQRAPVFAYFPLANCGSDPVVADVLGVKRAQLEGVRDPSGALISPTQTDPERMKKLAEDFLRQRGDERVATEAA
jgi:SNF2 family DNA or RNA helicase